MKTKQEVRQEYNQMRKDDKVFAECWCTDDYVCGVGCSSYLDYKHITRSSK